MAGESASPHREPREHPNWREILRDLDVHPSRALGQNFLHDQKIVERIVRVARLSSADDVLEVGPGLGILTSELTAHAGSVTAVELDARLARRLRDSFGERARIVEGDILELDLDQVIPASDYVVVANLPYSIATAVIQRFLEHHQPPKRLVLMVQREVAERMTARPPEMSILAVAVQFYAHAKVEFRIGSGAFIPPPRVESAVVRLETREAPLLPINDHQAFFRLVRAGFSQRRKRLDNAIAASLDIQKRSAAAALSESGIEPSRRAETLDVPEWVSAYEGFRELLND